MDDPIAFLRARLDDEQAEVEQRLRNPYLDPTDDELHQRNAHPAYEYKTLEGQRKAWREVDDPPEGEGWELNTTSADPDAFERFDYTEERYWRRRRPDGSLREWTPAAADRRRAAEIDAKRQIIELYSDGAEFPDFDGGYQSAMEDVLELLALPYAEHPDYREEWRP
ncbi:hypothetical protein SAMN05421854_102478 [Amycolatopsis rubida]|uniref:Uncharacterized protein n=2 Tax=Amycolatopsis rubida TaxID=112413 RepID=A0A1I5IIH4_9PSEU|nr:hypothetical protein SAMN05421854_102478 [Amycolatopsis rubida]